jgi:DNA-binding MarR family transcriptional regulator
LRTGCRQVFRRHHYHHHHQEETVDAVDFFSAQWAAERPGLDVTPLTIWGRLKRAASLFDAALACTLEEHDLNLAEFEVLAALVRSGPPYEMRPTELTQALIITAGAVTVRLSHLENRGFISRRRDPQDRRVQFVALSAHGLMTFEPAFDAIIGESARILGQVGAEQQQLFSSLKALLGVLDSDVAVVDASA